MYKRDDSLIDGNQASKFYRVVQELIYFGSTGEAMPDSVSVHSAASKR